MDNFAIHLIHQPESSKVCENFHGMGAVRCGAECQIYMTEIRIICLLLKFFHAIFVDKQFCFFQRIIRNWLIYKFLQLLHEQFQLGSNLFFRVGIIQIRLEGIKNPSALFCVLKLLFQAGQSICIGITQFHIVPIVIGIIFLVEVQKLRCKVMIMIGLLFFSRYFWCGEKRRKCLPSIEHGVSAVPICLHIFQSGFSYLIMPVILGCCFPQWQHHLIDFLYAGRDGQLFIYLLNTFPIVCNGIEFIGARIKLRCIYKKAVNASGKLPDLIACHCFTVLVRKESILRNHYADAFCNAAPFQLHLGIRLCQITMTE